MKAEVDTDWGFALSVAAVPNIDGNDDVYLVTARKLVLNNNRAVQVEKISQPVYANHHVEGIYIDNALTYSGASTSSLTTTELPAYILLAQTSYAPNEAVSTVCVADGKILTHKNGASSSGEFRMTGSGVTLGDAASDVIIGIPYTSHVETLPMSVIGQANAQGRRSRPTYVTMKAKNTRGLNVGYDSSSVVDVNWNDANDSETVITPKTRDQKVRLLPSRSLTPRLYFESTEPSPFNLLSFIAEVEPGD